MMTLAKLILVISLSIFMRDKSVVKAQCSNFYVIFGADTCESIAAAYRTTPAAIVSLNPGLNCLLLPIGRQICVPSVTPSSCTNFYTVFSGDTCDNIAVANRISVTSLLDLNPGLNCQNLRVGQIICVPAATNNVNPVTCQNTYTIRAGDTCPNIAVAFGIFFATLTSLNPSLNCNNLVPGAVICVPTTGSGVSTTPVCSNFYTIFSGDTCDNIASAFRITSAALVTLNPGLNCLLLQVGSRICVPSSNVNLVPGACPNFYTIAAGDTCDNIASGFRTTTSSLILLNPGLNCAALSIGQRICVPSINNNIIAPVCSNFYTIAAGDTCENIAFSFRINVPALLVLNPGLNCLTLQVTQRICVPNINTNIVPAPINVNPTPVGCQNTYTILPGDTCALLVAQFSTTLNVLFSLNPTINCANLLAGSVICVPFVNTIVNPTPIATCQSFYTVVNGDICFSIAANFRITLDQIFSLNPNINCNNLQIGQRLCVSNTNSIIVTGNQCTAFRTIVGGDTCFDLANANRISLNSFLSINPNINCQNLQIGQQVCISGGTVNNVNQAGCSRSYVIQNGDTCYALSLRFGVTLDSLTSRLACNNLQIGQTICL